MTIVPSLQDVPKPLGPYSHAVIANNFVFVSGQAPIRPGSPQGEWAGATITDQTRQCLRNLEAVLKSVGSSLADTVKVTVYLADPAHYREMNQAYAEFFPTKPPARSVARLGAQVSGLLISIDAIAVLPKVSDQGKTDSTKTRLAH